MKELSKAEARALAGVRADLSRANAEREHAQALLDAAQARVDAFSAEEAEILGDVAEARGVARESVVIEDARDPENERLVVSTVEEVEAREKRAKE